MLLICGPCFEQYLFRDDLGSIVCVNNLNYVFQKNNFNCTRRAQCPETNISSIQIQGDADYFINHLGVPIVQFAYEDIKALEVIVSKKCKTHTHNIADLQNLVLSWLFNFHIKQFTIEKRLHLESYSCFSEALQQYLKTSALLKSVEFNLKRFILSHFHMVLCNKKFAVVGLTSKHNCNLQYSQKQMTCAIDSPLLAQRKMHFMFCMLI